MRAHEFGDLLHEGVGFGGGEVALRYVAREEHRLRGEQLE